MLCSPETHASSALRHKTIFRAYEIEAFAGLVDGNRTNLIARVSNDDATCLRKQASAFAPLNSTRSTLRWVAKNAAKSLACSESGAISESRLPLRWHEAITSHKAISAETSIRSLSAYGAS